jgi:hypothetical protein
LRLNLPLTRAFSPAGKLNLYVNSRCVTSTTLPVLTRALVLPSSHLTGILFS